MIRTKCQNMLRWSRQNANQKVGTDKMPTTEKRPDKMPTFGWHYVRLAFCPVGILSAHQARLGTIYEALLIIIFIGVPIAMILLRCFTLKNIRKLDLFFLFFAITFWFWIIWWSFLLYHGLNQWATFKGKTILPAQWERICVWRIPVSFYLSRAICLWKEICDSLID